MAQEGAGPAAAAAAPAADQAAAPPLDGALLAFLTRHADLFRVRTGRTTSAEDAAEAALAAAGGSDGGSAAAEVARPAKRARLREDAGAPADDTGAAAGDRGAASSPSSGPAAAEPDADTVALVRAHEPALRCLMQLAAEPLDVPAVCHVNRTRSLWRTLSGADAAALAELDAAAGYWGVTKELSSDRIAQEEAARGGVVDPMAVPPLLEPLVAAAERHVDDALWAIRPDLPSRRTWTRADGMGAALLGLDLPDDADGRSDRLDYWTLCAYAGHIDTPDRLAAALACAAECGPKHASRLLGGALRAGDTGLATSLLAAGCIIDGSALLEAGSSGDLAVLEWVAASLGVSDGLLISGAAHAGALDAVKWLRARGCPWAPAVAVEAANSGSIELLEWLRTAGAPWDWAGICVGAAEGGQLHVLEWAAQRSIDPVPTADAAAAAALHGQLPALRWLAQRPGAAIPLEQCAQWAAEGGHVHVLDWLVAERGLSNAGGGVMFGAAFGGSINVLRWGRARGFPMDEGVTEAAAARGHLRALRVAVELGCPIDAYACWVTTTHPEVIAWLAAHYQADIEEGEELPDGHDAGSDHGESDGDADEAE